MHSTSSTVLNGNSGATGPSAVDEALLAEQRRIVQLQPLKYGPISESMIAEGRWVGEC
jgi:hypothetical protein